MKTTLLAGLVLATLTMPALGQRQTHGNMVGFLKHDSVVVWTRSNTSSNVSVLLNSVKKVSGAFETAPVRVSSSDDYTARIKVTGLLPGTKYYYTTRIADLNNSSSYVIGYWGEFTTPPAPSQEGKLTFLASGDVFEHAQFGIFGAMMKHPANFYLSMGDMPYADTATSQAEYWKRHRDTRNQSTFIDFMRKCPIEAMWDDHEVTNDWDKTTPANRVAWGKRAFFDYFPFPKGTTEMYRTIKWGAGVEIWLLDCRAYRDANAVPSVPTKTMLGATQKAWLKSSLLASTATFKILCSSIPVRWGKMGIDDWTGFVSEREEIFDFIVKNKVHNVVILSADSHVISVHNHREGIREYQCGPAAAAARPQVPAGPEVRFRASVRNFIVVSVDSTVSPAKMTLEYFDPQDNKLFSDEILAETPATGKVFTDLPAGDYHLNGPHYYHNRGGLTLPDITPGNYRINFTPDPGIVHVPNDIEVQIPAGSTVSIGGRWREIPGPKVLFADAFNAPLKGYTVLDETTTTGPSAWLPSGGWLLQASRIGGSVGSADSDRPGTMLITGNSAWTDYTTAVRMKSHDNGRIGVVFRYQDNDNYYRFFMDEQRPLMRLEKKVNGTYTTLSELIVPYVIHNVYDIRCIANGSKIKVIINDEPIFDVTDTAFSSGKVGFYVWQNQFTKFEDLVVTQGEDYNPPVNSVFTDTFDDQKINGWTIQDHATQTGASSWTENLGVLMQLANIGDLDVNNPIAKPGTVMIASATVPNDVQFTVDMLNYDDDGMGIVFRYKDAANHYRFSWNRLLRQRQLQKVVGGKWSILWSDNNDFNPRQWYRVRVEAVGDRLRLFVAGELLADVVDSSHKKGTVGIYSWSSAPVLFDRALIQKPHTLVPALVSVTKNRETRLFGRASTDASLAYGVGLALSRSPGVPLSILNAADPRLLELTPDFLFQASIRPSSMFSNFGGKLDANGQFEATIHWPVLAGLKGIVIYASGWSFASNGQGIANVFPTIEVIFP